MSLEESVALRHSQPYARCVNGHRMTPENYRIVHEQARCFPCMKARNDARYAAPKPKKTLRDKFEERHIVLPDGCWMWTASMSVQGYGLIRIGRHYRVASRISYELFVGPIPDGLQIDHLCRYPACVNWRHLEAVTQTVNVLRGVSPAAKNAKKQTCIHGHPLLAAGGAKKRRRCPTCDKERSHRRTVKETELRRASRLAAVRTP